MKTTTYVVATIAALMCSGVATAANGEQTEDILHGNGAVTASPYVPYVQAYRGPQDIEEDTLSDLEELKDASGFVPYVRVYDDRDNSEDMLSNLHDFDQPDRIAAR